MIYRLVVKLPAEKALARIPNPHRRRVAKAIDALARDPRPTGCAKLAGADDTYRIRVGDYRIVYDIAGKVLIVWIVRVAHPGRASLPWLDRRKDIYRGL